MQVFLKTPRVSWAPNGDVSPATSLSVVAVASVSLPGHFVIGICMRPFVSCTIV